MRVLAAKGSELEREFAFGVVRQLFEPALVDPDDPRRAGSAARPRPPADLRGGRRGAGRRAARRLVLRAARALLAGGERVGRPAGACSLLDDLHWIDRPSLRFVAYLVRRLEGLPVLVATTLRSTEPGTDPALLAEIVNDAATVPVQPGALSEEGVTAARARAPGRRRARRPSATPATPRPAATRCCCASSSPRSRRRESSPAAGNAALVRDIGPRAVSRTVLLRLARLPAEAAAVARAVAILGENADVPTVAALAEIDERGRRRRHRVAGPGRDPAARSAALLRAPAGARRRLPRPAARRARAPARARGQDAVRGGCVAGAGRLAPAHGAAARRRMGRRPAASRPAAPRSARARPRAPSRT